MFRTTLLVLAGCSFPGIGEPDVLNVVDVVAPPGVAERIDSVPVYGGTLEPVPALQGFAAADPEGNRLIKVIGSDATVIDLGDNARPFRVYVEETDVWVTLRGTGELVRVDLTTDTITWRAHVCTEPRGVARSQTDLLVVACADGPLVEVDDDGHIVRSILLDSDLRDVVPVAEVLFVSRFASAQVYALDPTKWEKRFLGSPRSDARVAWRMRPDGDDGVLVLHELVPRDVVILDEGDPDLGNEVPPPPDEGSYGAANTGGCGRLHESTISELQWLEIGRDEEEAVVTLMSGGSLVEVGVTDFAVSADREVLVAVTGATAEEPQVVQYNFVEDILFHSGACVVGRPMRVDVVGLASAVAFAEDGTVVVQAAAPAEIVQGHGAAASVVLPGTPAPNDEAVHAFHEAQPAGVSCASCHPEGTDDGNVWAFMFTEEGVYGADLELRRTMPLAGQLLERQPYHWDADLPDPDALMLDTFTSRMGGAVMATADTASLFAWLEGLRPVRGNPGRDADVVERGRAVFAAAGCAECHAGSAYTDGQVHPVRAAALEDVKTPSLLGVGSRTPLFHDGCATTLEARFTPPCDEGTDLHGRLSDVPSADIDALTAYLRTL